MFRDLTEGIVVGFALAGLVFIQRMSDSTSLHQAESAGPSVDPPNGDYVVYHLHGPYFFGAAAKLGAALDGYADQRRNFVVDFENVPFIDSTGARSFALMASKIARAGGVIYLTGTHPEVAQALHSAGAVSYTHLDVYKRQI